VDVILSIDSRAAALAERKVGATGSLSRRWFQKAYAPTFCRAQRRISAVGAQLRRTAEILRCAQDDRHRCARPEVQWLPPPLISGDPEGVECAPFNPFGVGRFQVRVSSVGFTYG